MNRLTRVQRWGGIGLAAAGLALLILNAVLGGIDFALPLVIMMLGGAFYLLVFFLSRQWRWAAVLFVPGSLLLALGLVLLLNVITGDWESWAYAWLLLVAGAGLGLALAAGYAGWRPALRLAGVGMAAGGLTLFALFGAIAGGPVIQTAAPLLLVLGGLALRWVKPEAVLPEGLLRRLGRGGMDESGAPVSTGRSFASRLKNWKILSGLTPRPSETENRAGGVPGGEGLRLAEPLTVRELEVLRLIAAGMTNQEIAQRMMVAPSTVKTHINNLYGKLGAQNRVQAIQRGRAAGLIK